MIDHFEPTQVADLLAGDDPPLLLDVREDWERAVAHIEGSHHLPMAEVPSRLDEIPADRAIVVVCHHGLRSALVARWLDARGRSQIVNLEGGIDRWAEAVDANVPRY